MADNDYKKISFAPETLAKVGLLDTKYPVPKKGYKRFVSGDEFQLEMILYWLQDYSASSSTQWLLCEPAMLRISELLSPHDKNPDDVHVEGDNWSVLIGNVDLAKEIVTIQRNNYLLAAIQNYGNGRLVVSTYRQLDAGLSGPLSQDNNASSLRWCPSSSSWPALPRF